MLLATWTATKSGTVVAAVGLLFRLRTPSRMGLAAALNAVLESRGSLMMLSLSIDPTFWPGYYVADVSKPTGQRWVQPVPRSTASGFHCNGRRWNGAAASSRRGVCEGPS